MITLIITRLEAFEAMLPPLLTIKYYQKAILISGDGDFLCLIDHWQRKGMLKRLLIPNKYSYSYLLHKYRKKMDFITDLKNKIQKK